MGLFLLLIFVLLLDPKVVDSRIRSVTAMKNTVVMEAKVVLVDEHGIMESCTQRGKKKGTEMAAITRMRRLSERETVTGVNGLMVMSR